jgi:hypothetical protein
MGKAEIISHLGDGRYSARLIYDVARLQAFIDQADLITELLEQEIADVTVRIAEAQAKLDGIEGI